MFTLSEWIRLEFGSQEKLENELGLGSKTISAWVTRRPRQFLTRLDFFTERGYPASEVLQMVQDRERALAYARRAQKTKAANAAALREPSAGRSEGCAETENRPHQS